MTIEQLVSAWRRFFFQPSPVLSIAIFRILFGLLVLESAVIHVGDNFLDWYGPNAVIPIESVKAYFWHNQPRLDILLLFPNESGWLLGYFASFVVAAVCLTLGLGTRFCALWVSLGLISLHHHDPFNINGGDAFLRLVSIFLVFSPCGYALSLDNVIRRKLGKPIPELHMPWAQRMIQLQLAIAYCATFWAKFSGEQWLDGTAVYYATRLEDLIRFDLSFLFDNLWFCKALSWYTLAVEFAMWTLVWVKELRYYVLAATLFLHIGIDAAINLPVFEWAFIATLVTFIDSEDIARAYSWLKRSLLRGRDVSTITEA